MATVYSVPTIQDLGVKLKKSTLVFPSKETKKKSLFLSNIDLLLNNNNITIVQFFIANPDYPPEIVSKRLKSALERVLVTYDFMAGRFKLNQESSRLEIDCNAAGAGFVVASSEYSLHELGNLVRPNLGFPQLALQRLENLGPKDDQPLCILQVTSFKCGVFAIGIMMNHALLDGAGALMFMENLAKQAFDDDNTLAVLPCNDRRLLAARSPRHVEFPHPEFSKSDLHPPVFDQKLEAMDHKVFKLSVDITKQLKENIIDQNSNYKANTIKISSLSIIVALIWRCQALSLYDENKLCSILNVVNIRLRLNPPLPPSYCGNAVLLSYASVKRKDIEKWPFSKLVEIISKAPSRVADEYAKSAIDWLDIHKGFPCGDYFVSSWTRLRFDQVEYPWGKSLHSGPIVSHKKDTCFIFSVGVAIWIWVHRSTQIGPRSIGLDLPWNHGRSDPLGSDGSMADPDLPWPCKFICWICITKKLSKRGFEPAPIETLMITTFHSTIWPHPLLFIHIQNYSFDLVNKLNSYFINFIHIT